VDVLKEWHDFYLVVGTAAATLIGAMFVVVSIGSSRMSEQQELGRRVYVTPTVMHLAVVLFTCALVFVPSLSAFGLGVLLGIGALGGLVYAGRNSFHISRREGHWSDRLWYGVVPPLAYITALGGAASLLLARPHAFDLLAAGLGILVASGIRNAWDLIIFFVVKPSEPD